MLNYILRRLLLIIPTLFGIMVINFAIVQAAPGGPVEQMIAKVKGQGVEATARIGGTASGETFDTSNIKTQASGSNTASKYRGAQGLDPEFIKELEVMFGFDKPIHERFILMMKSYLVLDFGTSYFRDVGVLDLILEKMPVSITLGLWSTLIAYMVSIPLGIKMAVRDGSSFDTWTSAAIIVGYAIPGFLFAILLIVLFASNNCFRIPGLGFLEGNPVLW